MASMAGGLSLGTLWINIAADVDAAVKSLQDFGKTVGEEIDAQKKKWDGLRTTGEGLATVGASLTAGLTLPIAGIGAASVAAASSFEASLNKITAVGGQTGAALDALRAQAMKLGADTKFSAQEAAEGMGELAAAGLNTTQIMSSMPGVLDLAAAGALSVKRAAELTTDTLSQFGLAADQAGRIADVMAASAAASSVDVQQMGAAMVYAGTVAQSAGASLEQTAAAIALLGNAGIKGEQAGTSLRGIISSLIKPSKEAADTIEELGIKTTDAAGKMLPLDQIFLQLQKKGASTADMFTIFGQNAASAAVALQTKAGPAWAAMTAEIDKSEGAAKRMADVLNSGLKGGLEQLKGSAETAAIALGSALLPVVQSLIVAGTNFINNFVLPAIEWFTKLPAPVQAGALALAALAAAIGPILLGIGTMITMFTALLPALGAMAGGLGLTTAGMFGWAAAIAAAVAALVALGVWVYQNWDAIAAGFISKVIKIEEAVRSFYSALGYTGGVKAIDAELSRLNKTLDDHAWKIIEAKDKTREMKEEQAKLEASVKKAKDEGAKASVVIGELTGKLGAGARATAGHKDETVKLAQATKEFVPPTKSLGDAVEDLQKKTVPASRALYDMRIEAEKSQEKVRNMHMPVAELGDYWKATFTPAGKDAAAALASIGTKAEAAKPGVVVLEDALKSLGLESSAKFSQIAADAAAAYKVVVSSDQASKWEKDSAFIKLLEAEQAAMRANGIAIPAEHQKMLTDLKNKTEDPTRGLPATAGKFAEFGTQVSTIITNFAQDISKSLWDGNTSFGEKGKALLSSLGQAVTSSFIEPATKAIGDFISGAIKNLLGGEGLGGVFDSLKGIGSAFGGLFGGGAKAAGGVAGAAGGAGSAAGGAGGAAGSAGSMLGSITGIVGAVGSIGTMISSIVFGIQQEKDMDTLADHTLRTFNELANLRIDEWVRWGDFLLIKDDLIRPLNNISDLSNLFVLKFDDIITRLNWIADQSAYTSQALDAILASADVRGEREESMLARMLETVERIAVSGERSLTMNLYGTDPSLVGGRVAQQLRLQGGFA